MGICPLIPILTKINLIFTIPSILRVESDDFLFLYRFCTESVQTLYRKSKGSENTKSGCVDLRKHIRFGVWMLFPRKMYLGMSETLSITIIFDFCTKSVQILYRVCTDSVQKRQSVRKCKIRFGRPPQTCLIWSTDVIPSRNVILPG